MKIETIAQWLQDQSVNRKIQELQGASKKWQGGRRVTYKGEYADPFSGCKNGEDVIKRMEAGGSNLEVATDYYTKSYPQSVKLVIPLVKKIMVTGKFTELQGDANAIASAGLAAGKRMRETPKKIPRVNLTTDLKSLQQAIDDGAWPDPADALFPPSHLFIYSKSMGPKESTFPIELRRQDIETLIGIVMTARQRDHYEVLSSVMKSLTQTEKAFLASVWALQEEALNDKNADQIGENILLNFMDTKEGDAESPIRLAEKGFREIYEERYHAVIRAWALLSRATGFFSSGSV